MLRPKRPGKPAAKRRLKNLFKLLATRIKVEVTPNSWRSPWLGRWHTAEASSRAGLAKKAVGRSKSKK